MPKKRLQLTSKQVGLLLTFCVLFANFALALAGIPSTISCTVARASAEASELLAEIVPD